MGSVDRFSMHCEGEAFSASHGFAGLKCHALQGVMHYYVYASNIIRGLTGYAVIES